ncbi:MAG: lectin-like protein [Planctomycetota bacterium]
MKLRILFAISIGLGSSTVVAQEFNPATGNTYFRTDVSVSFFEGRAQAIAIGAHLVALNDTAEDMWVSDAFPGTKWIGLTEEAVQGSWVWDSGEPLIYTNWQGIPSGGSFHDYGVSEGFAEGWLARRPDTPTFEPKFAVIESAVGFGPTIENVTYTGTTQTLAFSWTNPIPFTSIEVYRGVELIAELPGGATSFSTPASTESRYWFLPRGAPELSRPVTVAVIPPATTLAVQSGGVGLGETREVRTLLMNDSEVFGYTYGVCHDPTALDLLSVTIGSIEQSVVPFPQIDFHVISFEPEGFTVAMSLFGPGVMYIPVGYAHELEIATYEVVASDFTVTTLDFCEIGSPTVSPCVVLSQGGLCQAPNLTPGFIEIGPEFRRGDANADGVIDLADPIHHLGQLFVGLPAPCRSALDSNDDGAVNLADPIYTLLFLFNDGRDLPSPAGECGPDPTLDGLDCLNPQGCP